MQYSAKAQRMNGKVKNHSNQIANSYNAGIHILSSPNVSNSEQLQINRKYVNNMGNINEVSVFQYHRTTNMQIKNNNLEMNHYHNLTHQQQAFIFKNPQYNNHIVPNLQQQLPVNYPMPRKFFKEQAKMTGVLQRTHEYKSKSSKELHNQHEDKNVNNKYLTLKFRKIPIIDTDSREETVFRKEKAVSSTHKVSDKEGQNQNNNSIGKKDDAEQTHNKSSEHSALELCGDNSEISLKPLREKTPMCLINDLARFNKISFQYHLTSESGPAHCKRFTVTLILGEEEYTAEGLKIKQAQHLAAEEAIEKTKYKHPTPKTNRIENNISAKSNITPTVELNALAMKLGQQTHYIFDPNQFDTTTTLGQQKPNIVTENVNHQIQSLHHKHQSPIMPLSGVYPYFSSNSSCKITLIVGSKHFEGVGKTFQQAKHDAASNALKLLKDQMATENKENQNENIENNDKSPISLVFEMGIKRNLPVIFKVLREEGPAHMRNFVTACIVGEIATEGEGSGKKVSKKKAAEKMLEQLEKLPLLESVVSPVKRTKFKTFPKKICSDESQIINLTESKNVERTVPKNKKSDTTNPINKLLEWHQNKKETEPEFKLISELGKKNSRKKQFVMEVSSNEFVARGVGISKKLAKLNAAQNLLMAIAENNEETVKVENDNTAPTKTVVTETTSLKNCYSKNVAARCKSENCPTITLECKQIVLTAENKKDSNISEENTTNYLFPNKKVCIVQEKNYKGTNDLSSTSLLATNSNKSKISSAKSHSLHMKDQLMYLSRLLAFDVEFSDYPKGNHNEFLSIVMLSTTPPQICHGIGMNASESQEDAAKNALKILSEMGLNNVVKP